MRDVLKVLRIIWDRERAAGRAWIYWSILGAVVFLIVWNLLPTWVKGLLLTLVFFLGVPAVIITLLILRVTNSGATKPVAPGDDTWKDADSETRRILGMISDPRVINRHFIEAGLSTQISSFGLRSVDKGRPETVTDWALAAYGSRTTSGLITVNGRRYSVPRLVSITKSAIGPVAFFSAIPGTTEESFEYAARKLEVSLRVQKIRVQQLPLDRESGVMRIIFVTTDPLVQPVPKDFFIVHAAKSPLVLPLAMKELGGAFELPMHHTLVVGATGSGKGSVLQAIIRQLAPFRKNGFVRLWGGDIKRAEFKGFDRTSLFQEIHFDAEGQADMLNRFVEEVLRPKQELSGRSFQMSPDNPMDVIIIDEFSSLMRESAFKQGLVALNTIMSQGRSDGCYVIAASQEAQKAVLDNYRQHFANRIALRVEQPLEVDMVLGAGMRELGAEAHLIPAANEGNGYRTAGVGFVKSDGDPRPARVRFAYTSDEDMMNLWDEFPKAELPPVAFS